MIKLIIFVFFAELASFWSQELQKIFNLIFVENGFSAKNSCLSSLLGQGLLCGFSRISLSPIIAGLPRFTRLNRSTSVMTSSDLHQKYFDPF